MRDLFNNVSIVPAMTPRRVTDDTAQVGNEVHLGPTSLGGITYNSALIAIAIGTIADSNATFTVLLEEADSLGGSYAAVDDANLLGTEALASFRYDSDNTTRKLGYVGNKPYIRLTITGDGNTGNADFSAVAILGNPSRGPVGNPCS